MQAMQKPVNRKAPLVPVRCKSAGALLHSDGQPGQDRPVGPVKPGTGDLAAQDRYL